MSALGGVVGGVLALSALQAITSSSQASGRLGSLATGTAAIFEHLASPNVPLIPDLRTSTGSSSTSSSLNTSAAALSIPTLHPTARIPAPLSA